MKRAKNKVKHVENPLEKLFNLDEILGFSDSEKKQTKNQEILMREGQEFNLTNLQGEKSQADKEEKAYVEPGINYAGEIIHAEEKIINRESQELEMQLREIMAEIKKLADSSKELQAQFRDVAVEQRVTKPGKYHKNFFSWLLSIISAARMKVEDSKAWLTAMQSKKKSREYGAMAKKHGTTFTLNNERTVATQVG